MRMKTFLRFISVQKNINGIYQQKNIQNVRLVCQIIKARSSSLPKKSGTAFVSEVILYSLISDAIDVIDDGNVVTALLAQTQVNILLVGTIRKPSVKPIVLAKQWEITLNKASTLYKPQPKER